MCRCRVDPGWLDELTDPTQLRSLADLLLLVEVV